MKGPSEGGVLRGGQAPRGALRGGLGCQQGRQAEIDDRQHYRQRAALSELLCHHWQPPPVRGQAGPCRRGIWPPGRLKSKRRKTALRFVRTPWACKAGSAAGL